MCKLEGLVKAMRAGAKAELIVAPKAAARVKTSFMVDIFCPFETKNAVN
jgi:hypothetical protein